MKKGYLSAIVLLMMIFLFGNELCLGAETADEIFLVANRAYKAGKYKDAINGYQRLIGSGYDNGHIYYNLANAWFRMDDLGRAILNYERARLLIPRDADLKFNLFYVRDRLHDDLSLSGGILDTIFFWVNSLNRRELFQAFFVLNILFWSILILRLFYKSDWSYYSLLILMIFWFISGLSLGVKWYQIKTDDRAVILGQETGVLAGPDSRDTLLFRLHAGAVVHYEREEGDWILVRLSDRKRGWVPAKDIGLISQPFRFSKEIKA